MVCLEQALGQIVSGYFFWIYIYAGCQNMIQLWMEWIFFRSKYGYLLV